ncbi:lysine-sensitive aspartokinase 3 [Candidatus Woesearchaeota archaeon]|nr:lysine-sensitive aspartokinase 3 [Candidatus Woesearchaeota archaeon]
MIIMKFGGTSVGNAERIANVANIVKSSMKRSPVVVVSAVTKITDALIRLAKECAQGKGNKTLGHIKKTHYEILARLKINKKLLDEDIKELESLFKMAKSGKIIDDRILDHFQSFGERMSSKIVAAQLNKMGIKSQAFDSWELGFLTNDEFGEAEPLDTIYSSLNKNIKKLRVMPVITGFIGKTENGEITTLGRGGSDYTAAIIGAAVNADEIQIWTDVNGIMSTDPKTVVNAKTLDKVSFAEASELAYFGARVLHPKTILPAMKRNIPVKVLNSLNPREKGTTIVSRPYKNSNAVKAIAYKKNITMVNIDSTRMLGAYGFLARVFDIFDDYKKSIDVVSTSEVSVSLTIDNEESISPIVRELKDIADVQIKKSKAIICIVGEGMRHTPGIAGRTFMALGKNKVNIEMISQGASEINITFIVDGKDAEKAVKILHEEYYG